MISNKQINKNINYIIAILIFIPVISNAHSSHDPIKDINKKNKIIYVRQSEFQQSNSEDKKIKNLQEQISAIGSKILIIRNLMASDYPHVKEKMSKYKINYMKSVDDSLVQLKEALKQTETLLKQ